MIISGNIKCVSKFCHLHNHSHFSLLDGLSSVEKIVERAKSIGSSHVAITDHGNIYNIPFLLEKCKEYDVKPVIGIEFYYSPVSYRTRDKYHLLVLAKNDIGLRNIYKLVTVSSQQFYEKPKITREDLLKYKEGLIVTTGCIASYLNRMILENKEKDFYEEFNIFYETFGQDFLVEIQDHGLKEQRIVNKFWLNLLRSGKYKLRTIGTNDAHYVLKEEAEIHDMLLSIQTGKHLSDPNRLRFTDDNGELNKHFYMKSHEEMLQIDVFRENEHFIINTSEIANECEYRSLNFDGKLRVPKPKILEQFKTEDEEKEFFIELVKTSAHNVLKDKYKLYEERLNYEVETIVRLGYARYFILVWDLVNSAIQGKIENEPIYVGLGRGSAVGSLVAYVLGITRVDPVRYGLLFERFINPDRVSPPDIDIDFEDEKRDRVINYIISSYGKEKVSNIVTFGHMHLKMAVRDCLRSLGVPAEEINNFSSDVLDGADSLEDIYNDERKRKNLERYKLKDARFEKALEYAKYFVGKVRQVGVHASGVVVSDQNLSDIMGVHVVNSGKANTLVTGYDMKSLDMMGLLKVDVLGLRTLTLIRKCVEDIQKEYGVFIDVYNLDVSDQKVFDIFKQGKTAGVFQFESAGMRKYLVKMQPDRIEDLIALNALYRPGPLAYIDTYIDRKHGKEKWDVIDPRLKDVLSETYGIIVYQEQIMKIAQIVAGYTLGEADLLRRAIGKKLKDIIESEKKKFVERAVQNGFELEIAEKIYDDIYRFADYGFNKSHATAYTLTAYITAYLKAYYPEIFYKNLLNSYIGSPEEIADTIKLIYKEAPDIVIKKPDISYSEKDFIVDKNKHIIWGLRVKNAKENALDYIIKNISKNRKLIDKHLVIETLISNEVDKATIESLFWAGTLGIIANNKEYRTENNFESLINYIENNKKKNNKKKNENVQQLDIFASLNMKIEEQIKRHDFSFPDDNIVFDKIVQKEIEYFYYSPTLIDISVRDFEIFTFYDYIRLNENKEFEGNIPAILLSFEIHPKKTKDGFYMKSKITDSYSNVKVVFIYDEELFDRFKNNIGRIVVLNIRQRPYGEFNSIVVNNIFDFDKSKLSNPVKENIHEDLNNNAENEGKMSVQNSSENTENENIGPNISDETNVSKEEKIETAKYSENIDDLNTSLKENVYVNVMLENYAYKIVVDTLSDYAHMYDVNHNDLDRVVRNSIMFLNLAVPIFTEGMNEKEINLCLRAYTELLNFLLKRRKYPQANKVLITISVIRLLCDLNGCKIYNDVLKEIKKNVILYESIKNEYF